MVDQGQLFDAYWSGREQQLYHRHQSALRLIPPPEEAGPVLDLGSGSGLLAGILTERGYDVTCFDMSPEALTQCRARGAKTVQGDLNGTLPFQADEFGCVLNLAVLEHLIVDPANLLVEIHRVTSSCLIVGTSNWAHWMLRFQNLFGKYPRWPRPQKGDIRWISYEYAKRKVEEAGFSVVRRDLEEMSPKLPRFLAYMAPNLCAMNFTFQCIKK